MNSKTKEWEDENRVEKFLGGRVGKILTIETIVRTGPLAMNTNLKLTNVRRSYDVQRFSLLSTFNLEYVFTGLF